MSIRFAKMEDLSQILDIYAPYVEKTAVSFEYTVPTMEVFTARFQAITAQFPWLVWEEDGEVLGYAYGSAPFERAAFSWCAESSIYLRSDCRGRGIGKKLQLALEALLQMQGYQLLYALVTTDNPASIAFHKALGFTHLAEFPGCGWKLDAWHGLVWLEKRLNPVKTVSNFPAPFYSIVENDQKLSTILDKLSLF